MHNVWPPGQHLLYLAIIKNTYIMKTDKIFLNIALASAFALSLTGVVLATSTNATEALVLFIVTAIVTTAAAVTTWIKK